MLMMSLDCRDIFFFILVLWLGWCRRRDHSLRSRPRRRHRHRPCALTCWRRFGLGWCGGVTHSLRSRVTPPLPCPSLVARSARPIRYSLRSLSVARWSDCHDAVGLRPYARSSGTRGAHLTTLRAAKEPARRGHATRPSSGLGCCASIFVSIRAQVSAI